MKYADICKKFTGIVADYMSKGYIVNFKTMRGMGGNEVGKVDLSNGKEVVRVLLEQFHEYSNNDELYLNYDITRLTIGKVKDEAAKRGWGVWGNDIVNFYEEDFYKIGNDFYGTREECEAQQIKHRERCKRRFVSKRKTFSDDAKKAVLPFMRRQNMCKTIKLSDITSVVKDDGKYYVNAKGKRYSIA